MAEPLTVLPSDYESNYAWQILLQNHMYDILCDCSINDTHNEMMIRFNKSKQTIESIIVKSLQPIVE